MARRFILMCALLLWPDVGHAEWLRASSAHFVVYADDSERNIRALSQQLERYDAALALVTNARREAISPSNRVTIYVVSSEAQVRKLHGADAKYVSGFYVPRAGGSLAIIPRVAAGSGKASFPMVVLLHEYAHHFLMTTSSFPVPRWMSEGSAEFFASASFAADGGVGIGMPAMHRAAELVYAPDVTAKDLLDPADYDARRDKSRGYDAFYGKSWLLYHYLAFDEARRDQMSRYIQLLVKGKSSRDAGLAAFGDFKTLEKDLDSYQKKYRMMMLKLPAAMLRISATDVSKLSAGEAAIMPTRIRSRRGVNRQQATELLVDARAIAAKFPADPAVLSALAEAEHDAGNDREAVAAADAAIAIDPDQVNAYVQKGYALFNIASKADDRAGAYRAARAPFMVLNQRENDNPLSLIYYYRSFADQGATPPPLALDGLERAAVLAPFDLRLRMLVGMQKLASRQPDGARYHLQPVAFNPHGGSMADAAQQVLAHMERDPNWDGRDFHPALINEGANPDKD